MATDRIDRLVEKATQQQPDSGDTGDALATCLELLRRLEKLKDAVQRAVKEFQGRIPASEAGKWSDLTVQLLNSETMLIEKTKSPYIECKMSLEMEDDNASIRGTVKAAQHLPVSNVVVEAPVRIGLKAKCGTASYSFNGKTFTNLDSLAGELLNVILDVSKQHPRAASEQGIDFNAEMKAMKAKWDRSLRARKKRDARADQRRDAKAGRWP